MTLRPHVTNHRIIKIDLITMFGTFTGCNISAFWPMGCTNGGLKKRKENCDYLKQGKERKIILLRIRTCSLRVTTLLVSSNRIFDDYFYADRHPCRHRSSFRRESKQTTKQIELYSIRTLQKQHFVAKLYLFNQPVGQEKTSLSLEREV